MVHIDTATTIANLNQLTGRGLKIAPSVLVALDERFHAEHHAATPIDDVRQRLALSTSSDPELDSQSDALRALASQVTPTQVWDMIRFSKDLSEAQTYAQLCVRDGLLPHDATLLDLFSEHDSEDLRVQALRDAIRHDTRAGCTAVHVMLTNGDITADDLTETGHGTCTPITREHILKMVAPTSMPLLNKLTRVLEAPNPIVRFRAVPSFTMNLLLGLHDLLEPVIGASEQRFTVEGANIVRWLLDTSRRANAEQVDALADDLRAARPGLTSELIILWLGKHWNEHRYAELVHDYQLVYVRAPYQLTWDWNRWLLGLIESSHPSVTFMPRDVLEELIFTGERIWALTPTVRAELLKTHSSWVSSWLRGTEHPADPAEVRSLVNAGVIATSAVLRSYRDLPPAVRTEVLNVPGLPVTVARVLGENVRPSYERGNLTAVVQDIWDTLPDVEFRTQLMVRILTADGDLNGPLDGKAQLRTGVQVLTDRWTAQLQRRKQHSS